MRFPIKFFGTDAILHEDELNIIHREICFLFQFTAQGIDARLIVVNFAAGNPPQA
jgi:hypothetical protein